MKSASSLLGGAAVCALAFASAAGSADARPARHHHRAPAPAAGPSKVDALSARVDALSQRVDAQDAQNAQLQQRAEQAEARAAAAEQRADAAEKRAADAQAQASNAIQTIPTDVKSAVDASKPKPIWADSTQVSGRMYYDLTNISQKKDGVKQAPSGTGFDIKRFYVGIDHKFNDVFSANITTDVNYVANDGETQVFVKKAYLQAKFSDAAVLRIGSADLPWVPFVEDLYGYRYVENVLVDRTKFGTSADWGVHLGGKFNGGMFNYAISVVDGAGYKAPLRSKGMDVEGRFNVNVDHFVVAVGGYTGKLGKDNVGGATVYHTADRFDALAAYVDPRARFGVEYFSTSDWNNVTTVAADKADGYSVFGSYAVTPQIGVFGRYDYVKPNKDTNSSLKDDYFNLGVSYSAFKNVDFALVYKRDKAENGVIATSNGAIGGVHQGTYDEVGIWGQFRW